METLGSLTDKLTIANIRLWHLEDIKHASKSDREVADAARKIAVVNKQRNALIDELDELFDRSIKAGAAPMQPKVKLY